LTGRAFNRSASLAEHFGFFLAARHAAFLGVLLPNRFRPARSGSISLNSAPTDMRAAHLFVASDSLEQLTMTKETLQNPLALRPRQAAKALGISPRLLWQLTHDGVIPCVRVGSGKRRAVLYPMASLQAWLSREAQAGKGGDNDNAR
jgi:excisionase family DNA binding protein